MEEIMKPLYCNTRVVNVLGSARVSRVGFGVAPERAFTLSESGQVRGKFNEESAMARTPSSARETRALPNPSL
jgi:hypothetical protein